MQSTAKIIFNKLVILYGNIGSNNEVCGTVGMSYVQPDMLWPRPYSDLVWFYY